MSTDMSGRTSLETSYDNKPHIQNNLQLKTGPAKDDGKDEDSDDSDLEGWNLSCW